MVSEKRSWQRKNWPNLKGEPACKFLGRAHVKVIMQPQIEIDVVMVFLVAIYNMGVRMIWYSPSVFGKKWMKLQGLTEGKKLKDAGLIYSLTFFASLITAFTLELIISNILGSNPWTGLIIGFWAGIGFAAATSLSDYLFSGDLKKNELYLINAGYHILSLMLMGFFLGM